MCESVEQGQNNVDREESQGAKRSEILISPMTPPQEGHLASHKF